MLDILNLHSPTIVWIGRSKKQRMSQPNHHDPTPARNRGTRRERSVQPAEAPERPRAPETPTLILTRKSPDSNRILKKGKITHTPDVTQLPSTPTLNNNALGLTTPTQSDTKKSAAMQALMEEFTSQLESLSKTLSSLLNLNQDLAPIDTIRAQKALHSLSETLKAKATPQTLTKTTHTSKNKNTRTYAAVAAATPTQLPRPHLARHNKQLTRPRRLLIAPHSDSVKVPHKPPHEMRDSFNRMLRNWPEEFGSLRFKAVAVAVEYTRRDKIAITISPPSAAAVIAKDTGMTKVILDWARRKYDLSEEEEINVMLDSPWHRVVIHGVPTVPSSGKTDEDAAMALVEDWIKFNPLAPGADTAVQMCPLVPKAAIRNGTFASYESVSWCLAFPEKKHADWILRNGMYICGKHCRTSSYKPRGS